MRKFVLLVNSQVNTRMSVVSRYIRKLVNGMQSNKTVSHEVYLMTI